MIKEKVLSTIKKYDQIEAGDKLVIGVSGGPDSIALLNILYELKEKLDITMVVAHINHDIRKEADIDEEYVKLFCKEKNIEVYSKKINIEKIAKKEIRSIEEVGRTVRYEFFEQILNETKSNKIVTAHNLNDSIETILLNLIRGTGIGGLKGIYPKRANIIRPLIEVEKKEVEKYCLEAALKPKIDVTNNENIYLRNKVRNKLIPFLEKEFNPNVVKSINKLSQIVKEEDRFVDAVARESFDKVLVEKNERELSLNLKKYNEFDSVIKSRIVLIAMEELFGDSKDIEKVHIVDIIKLCSKNIGNKYLIPNKKVKIVIKDKKIFFVVNHK